MPTKDRQGESSTANDLAKLQTPISPDAIQRIAEEARRVREELQRKINRIFTPNDQDLQFRLD